jgi:hypothetical protein
MVHPRLVRFGAEKRIEIVASDVEPCNLYGSRANQTVSNSEWIVFGIGNEQAWKQGLDMLRSQRAPIRNVTVTPRSHPPRVKKVHEFGLRFGRV